MLAYPSYGSEVRVLDYYDIGTPAPERYGHIVACVEAGVRCEVAPVDLGAFDSNAALDPVSGRLVPSTGLLMNTGADQCWALELCRRRGLKPLFTAFDTIHLQNLRNLVEWGSAGTLPFVLKLFLAGASATPETLRFHRGRLRELFTEEEIFWSPLVYGTSQLALSALALSLGGHVRVGIGDHDYRELGEPTNATLVERIVAVARALGREPATPDEARVLMGITRSRE